MKLARVLPLALSAALAVTLWEAAKVLSGRRARPTVPAFEDGHGSAPIGAMNSGWVTLLAPDGDEPLARGRLMLRRTPPRESGEATWEGEIRPLHVEAETRALATGPHRVRVAESGEVRPVRINDVTLSDAGESFALISWLEPEPPATLLELGGY